MWLAASRLRAILVVQDLEALPTIKIDLPPTSALPTASDIKTPRRAHRGAAGGRAAVSMIIP